MSILNFISNLSQRQINIIRGLYVPIEYLIRFLDLLYPKNDKLIICGSNTGGYASGSPNAMYQYIKKNHKEYKVYYYLPFQKNMSLIQRLVYVIRFFPIFLNAKFLISSHPTSDFLPFSWSKNKDLINVWHGVPLKSLFYADSGESEDNLKKITEMTNKTSIFTVSSKLESTLIKKCFLINPEKIQITGHPRNDYLVARGESEIKKILKDIPEESKLILYSPTYRRGTKTKFFPFPDFDLDDLNQFLKENNIIILVRGHVYNQLDESTDIFTDRIIDFGFDVCDNVNSILKDIDVLITDYSSIYIDYLLLNRPCVFIPYDLEDYEQDRGLLLDYDLWAPGDKVSTYHEFITSLKRIIDGKDIYKDRRTEICNQLHHFNDDKSCERVFKFINNFEEG